MVVVVILVHIFVPFPFSNMSSQDLVAAKRRVSIFDKLRKNSKGVRLLLYY